MTCKICIGLREKLFPDDVCYVMRRFLRHMTQDTLHAPRKTASKRQNTLKRSKTAAGDPLSHHRVHERFYNTGCAKRVLGPLTLAMYPDRKSFTRPDILWRPSDVLQSRVRGGTSHLLDLTSILSGNAMDMQCKSSEYYAITPRQLTMTVPNT
jgi:hypothetical protein